MASFTENSNPKIFEGNDTKKDQVNKGAWTAEEDQKLAEVIAIHGAKRWKTIASIAGLNRCGKSCRLRWLNYLRPNIKRGNISDQEEDLILRLHKLLGNRWSLIAGRLPGRTDNEIKNYWNSHLSKKINHKGNKQSGRGIGIPGQHDQERRTVTVSVQKVHEIAEEVREEEAINNSNSNNNNNNHASEGSSDFDVDDFFDFSDEGSLSLEFMNNFL